MSARRALSVLVGLLLAAGGLFAAATAAAAAPASGGLTVAAIAARLGPDPLYVAQGATTPTFDAAAVRAALTAQKNATAIAVLPPSATAAAGGEAAALPGAISGALNRAGTVVVLIGTRPYASSTTVTPDRLGAAVDAATTRLAVPGLSSVGATSAVTDLVGALDPTAPAPSGSVDDPQSPPRAGGPGGLLVALGLLAVGLLAAVAIPLWLRRNPRAGRRRPPPAPPTDRARVEIDAYGRITKRVPAPKRPLDRRTVPPADRSTRR